MEMYGFEPVMLSLLDIWHYKTSNSINELYQLGLLMPAQSVSKYKFDIFWLRIQTREKIVPGIFVLD